MERWIACLLLLRLLAVCGKLEMIDSDQAL
jgi:hypothetical protein